MASYKALNTVLECIASYACYGVGDSDRGKTVAVPECKVSYACYGVWYGDRGKTGAAIECTVSYACYGVCLFIIYNRFGNSDVAIVGLV